MGPIVKHTSSVFVLALLMFAAACGGGGGGQSSNSGGSTQTGASGPVTVPAGTTVTNADITVDATTSPLNALVLGVADINATGGSATNTGGTVARGSQARVLMFGTGLNGNLQIAISGPNDITVSDVESITSTKGTPGVEFVVTVGSGAAIGARTVFLSDASGNTTAFAGGLEVQ